MLIARGSFVEHDFGPVEFEASRTGSSVTGRMTIAGTDGRAPTTVDLQCVRETEDGLVMIGGVIAGAGDQARPGGTPAWIALKRGSPEGGVGVGFLDGYPQTNDCLTYLDTWLRDAGQLSGEGATLTHQRAGTVEFGP